MVVIIGVDTVSLIVVGPQWCVCVWGGPTHTHDLCWLQCG